MNATASDPPGLICGVRARFQGRAGAAFSTPSQAGAMGLAASVPARALRAAGDLARSSGDLDGAAALYRRALSRLEGADDPKVRASLRAALGAVVLASVNIFGGFAVTERMLAMYKKKERK